jgi:hypothetical protein
MHAQRPGQLAVIRQPVFHFPAAIWRAVNILLAALSGGD